MTYPSGWPRQHRVLNPFTVMDIVHDPPDEGGNIRRLGSYTAHAGSDTVVRHNFEIDGQTSDATDPNYVPRMLHLRLWGFILDNPATLIDVHYGGNLATVINRGTVDDRSSVAATPGHYMSSNNFYTIYIELGQRRISLNVDALLHGETDTYSQIASGITYTQTAAGVTV